MLQSWLDQKSNQVNETGFPLKNMFLFLLDAHHVGYGSFRYPVKCVANNKSQRKRLEASTNNDMLAYTIELFVYESDKRNDNEWHAHIQTAL